ncbi:MAG: TIGR03545 family protein, partial [Gammaproteobacteria bacterium]|nr:TIGR03545 family protein [Gammaproteobacteria bacterium]
MNKWIRWKGLIPFVIIVAALAAFFLLFIDTLTKSVIESSGSDMAGAKVEVDSVDVRIAPLGMVLSGLKVANPNAPMTNAVEIQRIALGLDGGQLLMGKVIIDEMSVDQVRFDTPRKTSGALPAKAMPSPEKTKQGTDKVEGETKRAGVGKKLGIDMPNLELPNVDTVLSRETLRTQEVANELQTSVSQTQQNWDKLEQSLPDDDKVRDYQRRIDRIKKTDTGNIKQLLTAIQDLKSLQTDIQQDLATIDRARKQVKQDLAQVDKQYNPLLKAPAQDKEHTANKYAPTSQGIGNQSEILIGP